MYKLYFKQAIEMLKQNKFISMIAILGTALAIMMIMAIIVSDEIKNINVAPEINRDRTFYIPYQFINNTVNNSMNVSLINYRIYKDYLSELETPELISAVQGGSALVKGGGGGDLYDVSVKQTDASYWKIFSFQFIAGKAFTQVDVTSGLKNVIIKKSLARKLFSREDVIGEIVEVDFIPYHITGVVEDVSPVFTLAESDIWIPYSSVEDYDAEGSFTIILLAREKVDFPQIDKEVREAEQKYEANHPDIHFTVRGPDKHSVYRMQLFGNNEEAKALLKSRWLKSLFIFVILLMVPAINLSGLSLSRMKRRTEEIGIRKAFGAKRHTILTQVLYENLITSLIGGFIGLIFSYIVVYLMKGWLLGVASGSIIPISALISWPVLLAVVITCVLLNLLSAGVPAYRASRMTIVNSINKNDK